MSDLKNRKWFCDLYSRTWWSFGCLYSNWIDGVLLNDFFR